MRARSILAVAGGGFLLAGCALVLGIDDVTVNVDSGIGADASTDNIQNDTASTLSHELTEGLTDPHLDAWYVDSGPHAGEEIGDLCRSSYGDIVMNPNSIDYNIQKEWINSKGACAYGP